jgi:hypothetical protein
MKQRLINYLLKHLLCSISVNDIIYDIEGKIFIGGKQVGDTELRSLIAEAKALEGFRIWTIMQETVKNEAMDKGFNKAVSFDDLMTCKLMLHNLGILKSIVKVIKKQEKK